MPAGVRISFHTDSTVVSGNVVPQPDAAELDVYCDGVQHGSVSLAGRDRFELGGLPAGDKLIELWLPQTAEFRLRALELAENATVAAFEDARPRWITYGSSISHCADAESPSQTWPAIVARQNDLNLTCLGYGGNCHLDPMIARMMRDLPADLLSMKVGINVYGHASLSPRTFRGAIISFVRTVRDRHPDTPFAVASSIVAPVRETTPNAVGFTMQAMREEVAEAVAALRARGDRAVHYVDGLKLLGENLRHYLPDDVHPNAEGYRALARNFSREVVEKILAGSVVAR